MVVDGRRLTLVDLHARLDSILPIIVSLVQLAAAPITDAAGLRRIEAYVVHRPAPPARAPSREANDQRGTRDSQAHGSVEAQIACLEHRFERLGLRHSARKAVEQK